MALMWDQSQQKAVRGECSLIPCDKDRVPNKQMNRGNFWDQMPFSQTEQWLKTSSWGLPNYLFGDRRKGYRLGKQDSNLRKGLQTQNIHGTYFQLEEEFWKR